MLKSRALLRSGLLSSIRALKDWNNSNAAAATSIPTAAAAASIVNASAAAARGGGGSSGDAFCNSSAGASSVASPYSPNYYVGAKNSLSASSPPPSQPPQQQQQRQGVFEALHPSSSASSSAAASSFSFSLAKSCEDNHNVPIELDVLQRIVRTRRSIRKYDPERPVEHALLQSILATTVRSPTGFNLQPWHAIVVHSPEQKYALCKAALGQRQVLDAPITVVFAGDTEPERNAPAALEAGLENGYYGPYYGPAFLRNVYYYLHGGPCQSMAAAKSALSAWYSRETGTPLISVPVTRSGYAWKQTMIPVTTFVHLCSAAGLGTCMMEGIDEEAVKKVVELPDRFTVPVIVSVGYPAPSEVAPEKPMSPRFSTQHMIRWNKY